MKRKSYSYLDFRYTCQAEWTRQFRDFLFRKFPEENHLSVLEVGCGTGSVIRDILTHYQERIFSIVGVDIDLDALRFAIENNRINYIMGDGEKLPFSDKTFDLVYCHYLLLWTKNPVKIIEEMWRVTKDYGLCTAMAEPCYSEMTAEPDNLFSLAELQREKLEQRGADINIGNKLADIFHKAGIDKVQFRQYLSSETDFAHIQNEIQQMLTDTSKESFFIDPSVNYLYNIPTYFAYAKK